MEQYIRICDLRMYPALYEEAISFLKDNHSESEAQEMRITYAMKSWTSHPFGRLFWVDISKGKFNHILKYVVGYTNSSLSAERIIELLTHGETKSLDLIVKNNGAWMK